MLVQAWRKHQHQARECFGPFQDTSPRTFGLPIPKMMNEAFLTQRRIFCPKDAVGAYLLHHTRSFIQLYSPVFTLQSNTGEGPYRLPSTDTLASLAPSLTVSLHTPPTSHRAHSVTRRSALTTHTAHTSTLLSTPQCGGASPTAGTSTGGPLRPSALRSMVSRPRSRRYVLEKRESHHVLPPASRTSSSTTPAARP